MGQKALDPSFHWDDIGAPYLPTRTTTLVCRSNGMQLQRSSAFSIVLFVFFVA